MGAQVIADGATFRIWAPNTRIKFTYCQISRPGTRTSRRGSLAAPAGIGGDSFAVRATTRDQVLCRGSSVGEH